ncbi:DUF2079 domain-containing protein [Streptococcus pantholopis]|uniref:DUF2079 domain-containing protein n=1 Tax=Streptococcus pantholopis TaxID=1811193 RepID=A0A172Q8H8_9STRE|nr:DUF2079 domain-containing protein [Streptococcus pantholopis]AND79732.1 hypothetical protein A0O21_06685 [Streptococcus pantholopis]
MFNYFTERKTLMTWLMYLVNAYLLYAVCGMFLLSADALFLQPLPVLSVAEAFLLILAFSLGQGYLSMRFTSFNPNLVFTGLMSAYLVLGIYKSPSPLLFCAFFLLGLAAYFKLFLTKESLSYIIPASLLLTFPLMLYRLYHPLSVDLKQFVIEAEKWDSNQLWLLFLAGVYALCVYFLLNSAGEKLKKGLFSLANKEKQLYRLVGFIGLAYVFYLCLVVAYKAKTLSVSTFDIGIFSQMFESMRRSLTPMTTLERDRLLSHFAVHISPIYYLMLPVYSLFPYLETLEILQVLVVFSGVIPLHFLLKHLQLPAFARPLLLLLFVLTPAMTTAGSYHLHENCFLVPCLLWLLYANIKQWRWRLLLVVLLTLMIKEDAFIYVFAVGLYFLWQNRFSQSSGSKPFLVFWQLLFPLFYFGTCVFILTHYGDGVLISRFDLLDGQDGLWGAFKTIFLNPTYIFASFFTQHKLQYLFLLFSGLAFLPLMQKRWENYFLLLPLVAINLLSNYDYQTDFGFQYSYGSTVLVFFMALLALEGLFIDWQEKEQTHFTVSKRILSFILTALLFSSAILYSYTGNWYKDILYYQQNRDKFTAIHQTLAALPEEKKILAHYSYTVDLRRTRELYDIFYHNNQEFDSSVDLVVTPRSTVENQETTTEATIVKLYMEKGYSETAASTKDVLILEKTK